MLVIEPTNGQKLTHWLRSTGPKWKPLYVDCKAGFIALRRIRSMRRSKTCKSSWSAPCRSNSKAIRRVTQENDGKHTPGVDGRICDTPETRLALLHEGPRTQGVQAQTGATGIHSQSKREAKTPGYSYRAGPSDAGNRETDTGT